MRDEFEISGWGGDWVATVRERRCWWLGVCTFTIPRPLRPHTILVFPARASARIPPPKFWKGVESVQFLLAGLARPKQQYCVSWLASWWLASAGCLGGTWLASSPPLGGLWSAWLCLYPFLERQSCFWVGVAIYLELGWAGGGTTFYFIFCFECSQSPIPNHGQ